jgi:M6 family metalloprotease-like protein
MKHYLLCCIVLCLWSSPLHAQSFLSYGQENICVALPQSAAWGGQRNGLYIPSRGDFHGLIIFAQFPDDSLEIGHPEWPKDQPPARMNTWVDSVWTRNPTPYSMTDYFNQMSFGQFRFTCKTRFIVAPRTRQQYRDLGMQRGDIHAELIRMLDSTMDFAEFDRWTLNAAPYVQYEQPDKVVDYVMVVWRNTSEDIIDPQLRRDLINDLDFRFDQADLGLRTDVPVDVGAGNRRVTFGWGTPGAGITLRKPLMRNPFMYVMQTCIHETAHYFLGGNEMHSGFGFWAMLSGPGTRQFTANSFERHRIGWINLVTIDANSVDALGATLPDYVTTGIAYRYVIDSATRQFFYLENHQGISRWDRKIYADTIEQGLYVIRQDRERDTTFPSGSGYHMRLIPADGLYDWTVTRKETNSCCGSTMLPVFKQLLPDRHNGYHDCTLIPYTDPTTGLNRSDDIIIMEDINGNSTHVNKTGGDGSDAFRLGYQQVFSPWSNPTSQEKHRVNTDFGFEISGVNTTSNGDVYILNLYTRQPVDASPAKIQAFTVAPTEQRWAELSWQANEEPDLQSYKIYRSIVTSSSEPPASSYQLLTTINATSLQGIPITNWVDTSVTVGGQTIYRIYYRISAVDSSNQESVKATAWVYNAKQQPPTGKTSAFESEETQVSVTVSPNPSNSALHFNINVHTAQHINLTLFDALGISVTTILDKFMQSGQHDIVFDSALFSSGYYFYRLSSVNSVSSGMIVLHK